MKEWSRREYSEDEVPLEEEVVKEPAAAAVGAESVA